MKTIKTDNATKNTTISISKTNKVLTTNPTNQNTNTVKNLLSSSTKIEKGNGLHTGYMTKILYLAPYNLSGKNTCSKATKGCSDACLNTSGNGRYPRTQTTRINKTNFFYNDRENFMKLLFKEISIFVYECEFEGLKPCIRLNGTSDLNIALFNHNGKNIYELFPMVTFYDYTKVLNRFNKTFYSNYFLTASRDETNESECLELLKKGFNVAVVFRVTKNTPLPTEWHGFKVVDGDKDDLRHLDYLNKSDECGVVVGLSAKHKAQSDTSGFVIREF